MFNEMLFVFKLVNQFSSLKRLCWWVVLKRPGIPSCFATKTCKDSTVFVLFFSFFSSFWGRFQHIVTSRAGSCASSWDHLVFSFVSNREDGSITSLHSHPRADVLHATCLAQLGSSAEVTQLSLRMRPVKIYDFLPVENKQANILPPHSERLKFWNLVRPCYHGSLLGLLLFL